MPVQSAFRGFTLRESCSTFILKVEQKVEQRNVAISTFEDNTRKMEQKVEQEMEQDLC